MMQIELEPELEARLEKLAAAIHVKPTFFVQEAVARVVEDREDYLAGIQAKSAAAYTISQDEMERRAGVAD